MALAHKGFMMLRFLHSSDLHLGKAFGGYPEGIRNRLREARHGAIARLAQAARDGGADTVLLAGDTFDAETPAPDTLRHALRAMAAQTDIRWIMLPGNHDSLAATELWRRILSEDARRDGAGVEIIHRAVAVVANAMAARQAAE